MFYVIDTTTGTAISTGIRIWTDDDFTVYECKTEPELRQIERHFFTSQYWPAIRAEHQNHVPANVRASRREYRRKSFGRMNDRLWRVEP